ncbi:ladinin-1 isoform X2 [Acanthopagrus latus]|uniref:ladinin-1 isoform X2 n=1 Tax=Acanthopagrus latus TaxID=8177 RepID=UPI00187CD350|nr:ladinin-1 isoform X2 [Acanthopagrus latus]
MSISRKNWSALSSLARQWTMEDEEEVERERRRRVRGSSSTADPDADVSQTTGVSPTGDSTFGTASTSETSQGLSSAEQLQLDFVEMLRVRDEKRRKRHVETLRRQKELGEDEAEACEGGEGGARVELLGDLDEDQGDVLPSVKTTSKPQPPPKTASYSPITTTTTSSTITSSSSSSANIANRQHENGESSGKDPEPKPPSNPARKFVSSVSISLDKSPSTSRCATPMSPRSPTGPSSPREHWPSPCQSPSPRGAQSPVHNGHTQENGSSPNGNFEQTTKPAFVRQSSRTISFRMMRKKEEESAPLQRSASVRIASKKFESNTDENEDEDKASSFQRNSRQRISSRSIQEKMERLAQAAQKSEATRSPDVTQRTLFLLEEVSRKRGLFEKEQQAAGPASPGVSRQEFRSFTSGMSDRINRWLSKTSQPGSPHSPADLRNVDISSKRSLFESGREDCVPKTSPGKILK